MAELWNRLRWVSTVLLACSLITSAGWGATSVKPASPKTASLEQRRVFAQQEALNVYLANQDLQLHIAKQSSGAQPAGRLTSLRYKGRELLNQENAGFGAIGLVKASDSQDPPVRDPGPGAGHHLQISGRGESGGRPARDRPRFL